VGRVDAHFQRLQPVAVDHALEREGVGRGRRETVEVRKRRRRARPHIGKQDSALLHHRIGLVPDIGAHSATLGLGRRLQAAALDVEQPAVERAAQSTLFQPPEGEIGAAVRAGALEQAVTARVVPEQHEVFAEKANGLDRPVARQFVEQRRGLPVAPHQLARGRAGAGAGDAIILLGAQHARFLLPSFRGIPLDLTGSNAVSASLPTASLRRRDAKGTGATARR